MKKLYIILAVLFVLLLSSCAATGIPEDIKSRISGYQKSSDLAVVTDGMRTQSSHSVYAIPTWDLVAERSTHFVRGKVIGIGDSYLNEQGIIGSEVFFKSEEYLYGEPVHEDIVRILRPCGTVGKIVRPLEEGQYDMTVGEELLLFLDVTADESDPYSKAMLPYITLVYTPASDGSWNCTFESSKWEYQTATADELLDLFKAAK